jgi:hypothetical protein
MVVCETEQAMAQSYGSRAAGASGLPVGRASHPSMSYVVQPADRLRDLVEVAPEE